MQFQGVVWIVVSLLYGSGLRLMEALRLRVKDIDFDYNQITLRDAKGHKDGRTMLPTALKEPLAQQLERVKVLHQKDRDEGFGLVYLPYGLQRKYPNANSESGFGNTFFPLQLVSLTPMTRFTGSITCTNLLFSAR